MPWNIIPISNAPDMEYVLSVPIGKTNVPLKIRLRYNDEGGFWFLSVKDGTTNRMLIDAVPLVTGERPAGNLLKQYQYLGIGSAMIVPVTDLPPTDCPDYENLGTEFVLVWGDGDV